MIPRLVIAPFVTLSLAACGATPPMQHTHSSVPHTSPHTTIVTAKYPITLHITGLVYLIGAKGTKTRLLVVPNLTAANPRHAPLILATADYAPYGLGKQRIQTLPSGDMITYQYAELTPGLEIDLMQSGLSPRGSLDLDETDKDANGKQAECPFPPYATQRSLCWLPRLSNASGVSLNIKKAYSRKDPSSSDVATRIEIIDGSLDAVPGSDRFAFAVNGKPTYTQAVATELDYTFDAALDSSNPVFSLYGRQFKKNPNDADQFVEIARFKPYNGSIHVTIANVPEDDFFKPMAMAYLPHFELNYAAVTRFLGVPIATATRGNRCPGGPVGGTIECGPTQLP